VYASKGKWKNYWEIKSVVDHTYVLEQLDASHRNLSSGFVASQMFAKIVENPAFEPKSIILAIKEKFKYHISYGKTYMAKKKVMEMRWGTYEASYDNLPRLLNTIAALNPGSYYDIKARLMIMWEASPAAGILSIGSCYCCIQTLSTSYLHRWHIPNRKIQGHNPYSCGCRWQQSVVVFGNCFCRGREW
jgi:hypothetical protein